MERWTNAKGETDWPKSGEVLQKPIFFPQKGDQTESACTVCVFNASGPCFITRVEDIAHCTEKRCYEFCSFLKFIFLNKSYNNLILLFTVS